MLQVQERSPCTVKQYGHIARTFLAFSQKPLEDVTEKDLEAFREYLVLQRHYSKNSIYTTIRGLACLFRSFGLSTAETLEPPRRPERLPRYLSEEEVHRLLDAVKESPRDSAIVHVLAFGGLRVGELCHLLSEDVEFERNILHVRSGKGDKDREVVLEDRTRAAIDRFVTERTLVRSARPAALRGRARHGRARRSTGGPGRRHPAEGYAARPAAHARDRPPLPGLRHPLHPEAPGHASVATTQIYTHVDTQALRDAYQRAKPQY